MKKILLFLLTVGLFSGCAHFPSKSSRITVICPEKAGPQTRLAAKELRRYVFLRTGELPALSTRRSFSEGGSDKSDGSGKSDFLQKLDPALETQQFRIKTDGNSVEISGGTDIGVQYGVYRYAEKLGVRFYLHGDVIPDERLKALPEVNETGKPLFALRGLNPWGSHPFGFDAWNADDYKAIITQLARMRMNFIGMHCYPEGHPYAEPTVWHGLAGEFDDKGRVNTGYVSRYFNTLLTPAWGNYLPKKTSDYNFGGSLLFDDDAWAPDVIKGFCPLPVTSNDCIEVFNRMGVQFNDAFSFARQLGVKTCLGTEAPLLMPKNLAQRTKDIRAVYEGTFKRIMASHPLDYYWIWTPEGWTWSGNKPAQYSNTVADIRLAIEALDNVKAPFQLATCGWVLGPQHDRAAFDNDMPKNIPMSAISRNTGATEVDTAFGRINGREKWAIPWLEADNRHGISALQLNAGWMRRDAADALDYGCTGLMGLQWRTEIIAPNASALALAAWDQSWRNQASRIKPGKQRSLPVDDFYADFAQVNFGLAQAGKIFAAIDGKVPQVSDGECPAGSIPPLGASWDKIAPQFAFVDDFEKLRQQVNGAGNIERFDYWLNTFKYIRAIMRTRCAMGAKQPDEIMKAWTEAYTCLLATVNSPGALAMVVNMENHPGWGTLVAQHAKQSWPKEYQGKPRIIVPCVRSVVNKGEALTLKMIVLSASPCKSVSVRIRLLGSKDWKTVPARHLRGGVWQARLPAVSDDFEYHITAGEQLVWPVTAPALNQTVVTI